MSSKLIHEASESPSAGPVICQQWPHPSRLSPRSKGQHETRAARVASVIRHDKVKPAISKMSRRGSWSSFFATDAVIKQLADSTTGVNGNGKLVIEVVTEDTRVVQEPARKLHNKISPPTAFRRNRSRRNSVTSVTESGQAIPCAPPISDQEKLCAPSLPWPVSIDRVPSGSSHPMITRTASAQMGVPSGSSHPMITRTASAQMAMDFQVMGITRRAVD